MIREEIQALNEVKKYKIGALWSDDFDYLGLLKMAHKANASWDEAKLQKLHKSLKSVTDKMIRGKRKRQFHSVTHQLSNSLRNLNRDDAEVWFKEFRSLVWKLETAEMHPLRGWKTMQ